MNVLYGTVSYILESAVAARLVEVANQWRPKDRDRARAILAMAVKVEAKDHEPGEIAAILSGEKRLDLPLPKGLSWADLFPPADEEFEDDIAIAC